MAAQGEIPVYGKFVNETTNHVLAGTDQIKDDTQNKMQSTINAEQAANNAAQALTNQAQEQTNQANARDIKKALAWAAAGMVL